MLWCQSSLILPCFDDFISFQWVGPTCFSKDQVLLHFGWLVDWRSRWIHFITWADRSIWLIILPGRQTWNRLAWFVVRRSRQRGSDDDNDCCLGFGGLLESVEFHSKAWPPKFTGWWLVDGNVDKLAVRLKTRFQGSRSTRLVASLSAMRRRPSQEYEIWFAGSTSNVHDCLLI